MKEYSHLRAKAAAEAKDRGSSGMKKRRPSVQHLSPVSPITPIPTYPNIAASTENVPPTFALLRAAGNTRNTDSENESPNIDHQPRRHKLSDHRKPLHSVDRY